MTEIERARLTLASLNPSCSRELWIRIGMAVKSAGLDFEDFHNWSKYGANYVSEEDCRIVWKSFKRKAGITEKTLFYLALKNGCQDPSKIRAYSVNTNNYGSNNTQKDKILRTPHSEAINPYALDIWGRCLPAKPTHEYILRKQGMPDGLRYYPSSEPPLIINGTNVTNYLVVPCWSNGVIQILQFIPPDKNGKKLNLTGASFNDGYFTVGVITDRICLVEGLGQAWSAHISCGIAAVNCFGAGRIRKVASILRKKYPNVRLIIVPDRGKEDLSIEVASSVDALSVELPHDKPNNYDINDYALEYGYYELAVLLAGAKLPSTHYKLLSGEDLCSKPPMRWMVNGIIPMEGLAALYGASGSGKSFLVLDMAFSIASGEQYWFGHRVTRAPVIYVCLEGEAGMAKRLKALSKHFAKSIPDSLKFVLQPFNLLSTDIEELAKIIIATKNNGGLVIIDTLNRAAQGADENSSADMGNIIAAAKKLQNLIGGTVLIVHHTGKDAAKGLRGHSSLYAALDGAIEVSKTDTRREWNLAKSKDDVTGNGHAFKLEIVKLGFDDQDNEITSCVVLYDGTQAILPKKICLGRNQQIALKEIDRLLCDSLHTGKEESPSYGKRIHYETAVSSVSQLMPTDAKHQKSRAKDAISGLIAKHYLGMKGDWLWRA